MQAVFRDLAPSSTLRAAVNFGNSVVVQRDAAPGEPRGLAVDLTAELASRLSMPYVMLGFDNTKQTLAAGAEGAWDLAFLAVDSPRAERVDFTTPYAVLESTYLVRDDSPFRSVIDVDRAGVRVAVVQGGFYERHLTRTLKDAQLVCMPSAKEALQFFQSGRIDAVAGLQPPLAAYARAHPGVHVIEGRFAAVKQAIALPKGRSAGLRYLNTFVEQIKSSGRISEALQRACESGAGYGPFSEPVAQSGLDTLQSS